jgi:hypothetical protein
MGYDEKQPQPNTGYTDNSTPEGGIGENADACDFMSTFAPNLHWTGGDNANPSGRWYNAIIGGQIYELQSIWAYDKDGIQGCYSEVVDTVHNEFKAKSVVKHPVVVDVTAAKVLIPCRAFYIDRYHGGWTTLDPSDDACHSWFNGTSFTTRRKEFAYLEVQGNYHILSQSHARYTWERIAEDTAALVLDRETNRNVKTTNQRVFTVFQDAWVQVYNTDKTRWGVKDAGAWYFCRAMINGTYYVGETHKFLNTCNLVVEDVFVQVDKSADASVQFLVKDSFW